MKQYLAKWREFPYTIASWLTVIFPAIFLFGGTIPEIDMDTIAGLFLIHSFITKNWQWCKQKWVWCLTILWIYIMARSLLLAPDHVKESFTHSALFVRYFVFAAAVAYWTFRDPIIRQRFLGVLTAMIFFLIADGLLQYFTAYDLFGYEYFGSPDGHVRLGGTFRKPILGIMLAWFCFPVFVQYLANDKTVSLKNFESLFFLFVPFLVLGVITLSGERLALLLVLLGWAFAFFFLPRYRFKIVLSVMIGLIAVFGTAAMDPLVLKRQGGSTLHTFTDWWESPYGTLLATDLRMAKINPVFGTGAYQFRVLCPKLYPGFSEADLKPVCNIHPHNIYLEWLIEEGYIGLTVFVVFLVKLFGICVRNWKTVKHDPLFIGFLIAFILRIWPFASTTGLFSRWGASPFWLVVGCLLAYTMVDKERQEK